MQAGSFQLWVVQVQELVRKQLAQTGDVKKAYLLHQGIQQHAEGFFVEDILIHDWSYQHSSIGVRDEKRRAMGAVLKGFTADDG